MNHPSHVTDPQSVWFGYFSFRDFVSEIWVWVFFFLIFNFNFCESNLLGFFSVLLLIFLDLLILFLGMQNFWDLLDFLYRLVC